MLVDGVPRGEPTSPFWLPSRAQIALVHGFSPDGRGMSPKLRSMVQESEISCSGFQRARRLFGRGAAPKCCCGVPWGDDSSLLTVSPHERGMERGRLLSPLPKMERCHRAHLVSLTNDLWVLFYGDNIREFLTPAPHPALSKRSL